MKKLVIILALFFCAASAYAESVSSIELIEKARQFNGRRIIYKGEMMTNILNRGEYSWAHVNDGNNTIGVWCRTEMLKDVSFLGDYKHKGDIVEVSGIFNRACQIHGGELDIHAEVFAIRQQGHPVKERISHKRAQLTMVLVLTTLVFVLVFRKRL